MTLLEDYREWRSGAKARFLASLRVARESRTLQSIADELGVTRSQVWQWLQESVPPAFIPDQTSGA